MPRTARASVGGVAYHVLNRGNAKARVFHKPADYQAFIRLMDDARSRIAMRVLAYCLMPNHFHLVLWPHRNGDLSRWMQWLLTAHVRRHHRHHSTTGRLWQGRFKAFPIQQDRHLLTVMRYVERNPLRANLVRRAEDWRWSSLAERIDPGERRRVDDGPLGTPPDWLDLVNEPQTPSEVESLRTSAQRERPFGHAHWILHTAIEMDLVSSLRPRGRPGRLRLEIDDDRPC